MKPSRLAELQHQRELVREHLAWLDREITAALGLSAEQRISPSERPAARAITPPLPLPLPPPPDPALAAASARRGCFTFVIVAALLGVAALTAIYFIRYRDHPLIFIEEPAEAPHR